MFKNFCEDLNKKLSLAKRFYEAFKADFALTKKFNIRDLKSTRNKAGHVKRLFKMVEERLDLIEDLNLYEVVNDLSLGIIYTYNVSGSASKKGEYDKMKDRDTAIDWLWENGEIDYGKRRITIFADFVAKPDVQSAFLPDNLQIGNLDLRRVNRVKIPKRLIVDDLYIDHQSLVKADIGYLDGIQINGNLYIDSGSTTKAIEIQEEADRLKKSGYIKGEIIIE